MDAICVHGGNENISIEMIDELHCRSDQGLPARIRVPPPIFRCGKLNKSSRLIQACTWPARARIVLQLHCAPGVSEWPEGPEEGHVRTGAFPLGGVGGLTASTPASPSELPTRPTKRSDLSREPGVRKEKLFRIFQSHPSCPCEAGKTSTGSLKLLPCPRPSLCVSHFILIEP